MGLLVAGAGLLVVEGLAPVGAARAEPNAAGVNLTPPGPGSFTATFLCIAVGKSDASRGRCACASMRLVPSSGAGFVPP